MKSTSGQIYVFSEVLNKKEFLISYDSFQVVQSREREKELKSS